MHEQDPKENNFKNLTPFKRILNNGDDVKLMENLKCHFFQV